MKKITYVINCVEPGNVIGSCSIVVDDDYSEDDIERAVEKDFLKTVYDSLWWEVTKEETV